MVFYVLAALGGLTVLVLGLILVFVLLAWFSEPVPYSVPGHDLQRFFSSWGIALGDRGKIIVRQAKTDRSIQFVKRDYKTRADRLVLRCRNADETRKYFESVKTALEATGNDVKIELTPRGKPRAALLEFNVEDPLMPSAAAHVARVALSAMGASVEGPFELYCQGSHRADYQPGSVEVSSLGREATERVFALDDWPLVFLAETRDGETSAANKLCPNCARDEPAASNFTQRHTR